MQLMQHSVQKSSTTMRPFRSASLSGLAVLSQAVPPVNSGAGAFAGFLGSPPVMFLGSRTPTASTKTTATVRTIQGQTRLPKVARLDMLLSRSGPKAGFANNGGHFTQA